MRSLLRKQRCGVQVEKDMCEKNGFIKYVTYSKCILIRNAAEYLR